MRFARRGARPLNGGVILGVNIDHVATLREVRKATYPSIVEAAKIAKRGGAGQITIHLREDRRHIQDRDLHDLMKWGGLPINLEMGLTYEMLKMAEKSRPFSVTLVPERRAEMTTESGLNLKSLKLRRRMIDRLKKFTKVYGFIDPDLEQVRLSRIFEFEGIEFHTGPFSFAFEKRSLKGGRQRLACEVKKLVEAARLANALQLEVKAGHGLTLQNIRLLRKVPHLIEVNIGHSIVARSVFVGLEVAVREMKKAIG